MRKGYNRRRSARYGVGSLTTHLHTGGGLLGRFKPSIELVAINFNRHGMFIRTKHRLKVGDKILLDIHSKKTSVEHLPAVVRHISENGKQFDYGVRFETDSSEFPILPGTIEKLAHIEQEISELMVIAS